MDPTDWREIRGIIASNGPDKSAGLDGVNCDLVELHSEDSKDGPSPFLETLTALTNVALRHGTTLKSWRKAIISMVPKRKDDGSFTSKIAEMRPISVLQEFGKISAKLISNRLGNILLKHPHLLNSAQRAFLKDGCTAQCITTLLNVLEDFKSKQKKDSAASLFILAYDQVKAYDSVQAYTIQASLERFNLPPDFINYVLSNLDEATSCFKTFYGPTEDFSVEASVRQGDPLSPLIYIFITDALHDGFRSNPLFEGQTGYSFSNDPSLTVASLGYADDTLTCNESWFQQWISHEWIRDFCHAHNFRLNTTKCRYIISDFSGASDGRWLWSVDGLERIHPLPSTEVFRYLGLWISMNLDWSKQIHVLNKHIMDWRWKSFAARVDPAQLRASYVELLLPRLEIGLLHANITRIMCDAWMSSIIYTICRRGRIANAPSLNRMAFCILADIPDLWMRTQTTRATELLCDLNSRNSTAGLSSVARLCALTKTPDLIAAAKILKERKNFSRKNDFRFASTLRQLKYLGVNLVSPSLQPSADVETITREIALALSELKSHAVVYTDGSTSTRGRVHNSGSGIFITDDHHCPIWSGGFVARTDGNNFIAELAAAAIVSKACPDHLALILRIDSMAAIGALTQGAVSERKRIRAPGRAWLNLCRSDIGRKRIIIEHVSAHTGAQSPEQKGNDTADALANRYRREGELLPPAPYLASTEEALILEFQGCNVQNDPRDFLKRSGRKRK